MMGKFDVLEPCGALKTKSPLHVFTQSGRAVELRWKNHDQSLYPSGRIKGKRRSSLEIQQWRKMPTDDRVHLTTRKQKDHPRTAY
jgi:hypothetical protein